ncbi:hypothetical protein [Janthinobacterium lividum]|uniref:hypothetical protein n=1 Tax=Janthinobacterium lividum TaxID=29581 RepID=UPI00111316D4|nr:hypothetical protein [Janthinobacterium lividum]WQE27358.1 hypothetical protein U0004_20480 [Janthinobacterium lividum]
MSAHLPDFCRLRILYNAGKLSRAAWRLDETSPFRHTDVVTDDFPAPIDLSAAFFVTPAGMAVPDDCPSGRHFPVPTLDTHQ